MEMETVTENSPAIQNLIAALEQATQMAKQLPNTTNPSQILQIYSTLHFTHTQLSSFLSNQPPIQPSPPPPPSAAAAGNSPSSEPMEMGDGDEEVEEAELNTIERVEERMRNCFIQNKRRKRPLSPAAVAAAEQRVYEHNGNVEFDPYGTKMRALDLIYQFHG